MDEHASSPPPLDRLIVGSDGSREARAAVRFGARLAGDLGVKLRVATSWEHPAAAILPGEPDVLPTRAEADAATAAELQEVISEELGPTGSIAEPVVLRGRPANALVHLALDHPGAVVIVGTRGRDGFTGMVLGSTARALLHDDRIPVVIVHDHGGPVDEPVHHIVVGVDGTPGSHAAATWAAAVAARTGATVIAVHGMGLARAGMFRPTALDFCERMQENLDGPWIAPIIEAGVTCRPVLSDDDPRAAILRVADDAGAGLVVMGRSSGSGFARWAIGNVAESVVRNCHRPIAVVSPPTRG